MTSIKLIVRNVKKNMKDYIIYFLTLMISVSMFYAFNSIQSQSAFKNFSLTRKLLSEQLGILISYLSVVVAIVLAFLILYANQFLLKRRKKELGIYILLGMEKGKISRIFAGETLCVGVISLVCGLGFGFVLSQGLSIFALHLFAVKMSEFQIVFSLSAFKKTIGCFALIFLIVILINVRIVSKIKLIDLLTSSKKNETLLTNNKGVHFFLLGISFFFMIVSGLIFHQYGIMPSRKNSWFQIALALIAVGTILFFYSVSAVVLAVIQNNHKLYWKGVNTFLIRQIGSKIRTDFIILAIVCSLLTIAICALTSGISTALTMNKASKCALPFNLNVIAYPKIAGETDISKYLKSRNIDMSDYAKKTKQISLYEADITYGDLFKGQDLDLWQIDRDIPSMNVFVISITDFNRSMAMQGEKSVSLKENEFLLNCNYKGTFQYIKTYLKNNKSIKLGGKTLQSASETVLQKTYWMTSIGNNDRGTLIVPDIVADSLEKNKNILLVQYKASTNSDEVIKKLNPIGLDWEKYGYQYTEKDILNDLYFGSTALTVFLCCYIGLIFLLICAALLSLKQLTETADNIYRYGILQKLGTDKELLYAALFRQVGIFFVAPLVLSIVYSIFGIKKIILLVENCMNLHIVENGFTTVILFLLVYGGYFLATYFSCKHMIKEKHFRGMEI